MKIVSTVVLPPLLVLGTCLGLSVASGQSVAHRAKAVVSTKTSRDLGHASDQQIPTTPAKNFDEAVDRAIAREHVLVNALEDKAPVIETYIQEVKSDQDLGFVPTGDRYFLGKLDLKKGLGDESFIPLPTGFRKIPQMVTSTVTRQYFPRGFAYMVFVDQTDFDRSHYQFSYVRREFLGDVRCIVADVYPAKKGGHDRFEGRIWIEDEGYNVVRFNGVYVPVREHKHSHFDSWRVNSGPGLWLPAYVYTQEGAHGDALLKAPAFRAQTRLWDYEPQKDRTEQAFTNLTVEIPQGVKDQSDAGAIDNSPVQQKRLFQREAEDNVLERLEQAGLIAPKGEVDQVLDTVLNNLLVTNNLNVDLGVRTRILLTTPLESAPVGHTILLSRGLIDVLPDEASLAAVIGHELAHIVLGHEVDSTFAFADRLMFDDPQVLDRLKVSRTDSEEEAADQKAVEILKNSPYKDKLPRVGLFLRMLEARTGDVPHLIKPLLGNQMADTHKDMRLSALMDMAPELQVRNVDQVSALPLGSRIRMNPWNDELHMMKSHNVALVSAKEKLPFEITPFVLHLTREPNTAPPTDGSVPNPVSSTAEPRKEQELSRK